MKQLVNIVNNQTMLKPFTAENDLEDYIKKACLCQGAEVIACPPKLDRAVKNIAVGYHLVFYPNWMDFYLGNQTYLIKHFGTKELWREYYGCEDGRGFLQNLINDMDAAQALGAEYAVFHCADVSNEEVLLNEYEHTNAQVIDATAHLINAAVKGKKYTFKLLFENLFVPGMTLLQPRETERLLDKVNYANCGIMLDTGHLMAAMKFAGDNVFNEKTAAEAMCKRITAHGQLKKHIAGVHLHSCNVEQAVEEYLEPISPHADFYKRCEQSYGRILKLDAHSPLKSGALNKALDMLDLSYIVHELRAENPAKKAAAVLMQKKAMGL